MTIKIVKEEDREGLFLSDRADLVKGHYCITRKMPDDERFVEYYNKGKWCAFGEVFTESDLINAVLDKRMGETSFEPCPHRWKPVVGENKIDRGVDWCYWCGSIRIMCDGKEDIRSPRTIKD